jgi:dihydroorotate dehydrogenase
MTTAELEAKVKRATAMFMEAVEQCEAAIAIYSNGGVSPAPTAEIIAAGAAMQVAITALGSGPASNRAKLDTVR